MLKSRTQAKAAQDSDARHKSASSSLAASPEVLRNINLDFEQGSFHFITGVSGAGKSTLLKLIYLGLRPSAGQIYVSGQPVALLESDKRAALRRRIGVVFQDYRLLDHLTVEENVALPLRVAGFYNERKRSDILDLLTWVGLGDNLASFPQTLSGGQKQRVALARAVITRPQIILADEPTGNLDDGIGTRLIHLFEELNRIGTTVVVATHSKSLIERFPHPVLSLSGGVASLQRPEQYLAPTPSGPTMSDQLRQPQFGKKV